jgi:hypothetical protein
MPASVKIPIEASHARNYERAPWCYLLWGVPAVLAGGAVSAYNQGVVPLMTAGLIWAFSVGWAGVGCFVNGRSCGRVHCKIDGYLFLPLAFAGLLNALSFVSFSWNWFWLAFFATLVFSFIPEFTWKRYIPTRS